jgi:hypothetical protein
MTEKTFPASLESLTSEWLTQVLQADGILKGGTVQRFSAKPLIGGVTAEVYRLLLEYKGDVGGAPQSLVVKFPVSFSATRATLEHFESYKKEVRFYQILGQDRSLPIPVTYAAEFDTDTHDFVLLMEDLSAARPASEEDPLGDIRIALPHLAEIHAKFWGDPQLEQHDWINQANESLPLLKGMWATNLAQMKIEFRDQLSDYTWSVCEKWLEFWDEITECMTHDTHTLVHTDAHRGQMFFPTAELQRFVLFDWQYPSNIWGAFDVACLIMDGLSPENRREHEESLIDLYYEALSQQGVHDLTKERLWFQCKLSHLARIFSVFNVAADPGMRQTLKAEAQEQGEDWQENIFGRIGAATEDWKLADILDQAIEEARTGKASSR